MTISLGAIDGGIIMAKKFGAVLNPNDLDIVSRGIPYLAI
jgi:hypothetical protein